MKRALLFMGLSVLSAISFAIERAHAELINREGKVIGRVELLDAGNGVLLKVEASNLPPNRELAFHIHEKGSCIPPDFKSAKGHFNPFGKEHGLLNPKGFHAGDMPNVFTDSKGNLRVHVFNPFVTLKEGKVNSLFKEGGTAIVIHEKGDDYRSNPAGNAGKRIACGVIKK